MSKIIQFPKQKGAPDPTPLQELDLRTWAIIDAYEELYHEVQRINALMHTILRCLKKD